MATSYCRPARRALVLLALAAALGAPAALGAQEVMARPPLARLGASIGWGVAGTIGNSGVTTGAFRLEVPVTSRLAPWASWSSYQLGIDCIPEAAVCLSGGSMWLAGVMLDASDTGRQLFRPYLGAGIGRWRNDEGTGFAQSVVLGLALEVIPVLAPRVELRMEKYPPFGRQGVLAVGLQLTIPRPRGRAAGGA